MDKKNANKIIRQRTHPSIFDFCYATTRTHFKAFLKFRKELEKKKQSLSILDLGCGYKPFKSLLSDLDIEKYIGVDFDKNRSSADIEAGVEKLPLSDNSFDAIIASEVFEHTLKLEQAIDELRRVAKNGALAYISTPFMFGEHGVPYDFQRITRYKYFELFKNDDILLIKETNNNLSTLFFLTNVCWELTFLKRIPILTHIFYLSNNICVLFCEIVVGLIDFFGQRIFSEKKKWFKEIFNNYFYTMTGGYDVIVRIKK